MNVQDFIKTAITEIVAGVAEAREAVAEYGASAGSDRVYGYTKDNKIMTDAAGRQVTVVEFDIALAQTDATDTKGGIGVFLGTVGLGSQGSSHGESSTHSRIKFNVPIVLPGKGGSSV
ncbi:hypothetical protein PH586_08420 [Pseudomonas sp. SA3-5]|uniref:Uncharacterized protein n=1 Tax=Pseudomonas aestuarii TaxID=3018340 RepID=A0ABT4XDX2_9PSED|nr:hypothetical protein [Pseudomonas aestuarii]MDA7086401.1 hypothetical protein [Pseudomonas aestuarii]